jgi:isopenicillin N synthase-like dioxygenase
LFREQAPRDPERAAAQIPVIDLGPVFADAPGALEGAAEAVREACGRVGFFYVAGHRVAAATIERCFAESRRFHALPLGKKAKLALDQNNIGYLAMNASIQRHSTVHQATRPNQNESFFVSHDREPGHPDVRAGKALRGRNQWPDGLPGFREGVMAYFDALNALGQRLLPIFARALGMPDGHFAPLFADENHATLRLLHYPPTRIEDNDFGTGPHTDNSFMTILARSEVPGLAIRMPSGEWLAPPLIDGTFLVNIGNMMRRMSNDRFLSTPHGVVVEGEQDRYSIAYFHSPNPYRTIEVLSSCVDDVNPAKYRPALYADLIKEFFASNYNHQRNFGRQEMANRYN